MEAEAARVTAAYRVAAETEGVALDALRVPGQRLELERAALGPASGGGPGASLRLTEEPALYRLGLRGDGPASGPPASGPLRIDSGDPAGEEPAAEIQLVYTVRGATGRVPVFVPRTSAPPGGASIEIRIRGLPPDRSLAGAFPRLWRDREGEAVARPDNLPSFVLLPSRGGVIAPTRVADLLVVVLILGATGYWVVWRRRRDRPAGRRGVVDPLAAPDVEGPRSRES